MSRSEKLNHAIRTLLDRNSLADLRSASAELSDRYRHRTRGRTDPFMDTDSHRKAYLLCRMPATFAVLQHVFAELCERMSEENFSSLLDLGAGPGTTLWAALEEISSIKKASLIEQDMHLIALGKQLAASNSDLSTDAVSWKQENIVRSDAFETHDLVVISYALGELPMEEQVKVLHRAWNAASKAIVIIEPGTPAGFATVRHARSILIEKQGYPVAPCPHADTCPMADGDWCHFSVRLERSRDHRQAKEGSLGYEDEKYSYIVMSKTPVGLPKARVLSSPLKRSGHFVLKLCSTEGLTQEIISKRHPDAYKKARKLEWGSSFV